MPLHRLQRAMPHLRVAFAAFLSPHASEGARPPARRRTVVALLLALALAALFLGTTQVTLKGRWYGIYLLRSGSGRPFELKDDLKLGDGPRLLGGVSFSPLREFLARGREGKERLELDWDEEAGGGVVSNYLKGGEMLQTSLGRFVDSEGRTPAGLFVGGAIADVASSREQNQSGMALRDSSGWHHVWCNVNELLVLYGSGRRVFPGDWTFRGSRLLVESQDRVVIESDSALSASGVELRMERYAYFKAGVPWFRLGINILNVGDAPVTLAFGYGDEPWVGEFGSAEGNVGWSTQGVHDVVTWMDPAQSPGAGILDLKSGLANFIAWEGSLPDRVYFGNHAGTPEASEFGQPLTSNEVFIGLEWLNRTIEPGEVLSLGLTIGVAVAGPDGKPTFPERAIRQR